VGNWDGPYIDELPKDPWGNDYNYAYEPETSQRKFPNIWSNGPDGTDSGGADDDICNWKADGVEGEGDEARDYFGDDFEPEPEPEF